MFSLGQTKIYPVSFEVACPNITSLLWPDDAHRLLAPFSCEIDKKLSWISIEIKAESNTDYISSKGIFHHHLSKKVQKLLAERRYNVLIFESFSLPIHISKRQENMLA